MAEQGGQPVVGRWDDCFPVGVVLVSHTREVAESVLRMALVFAGGPAGLSVAPAGGTGDGGVGTSSELIIAAVRRCDQGAGVVVLADLGSAVLTVRTLLRERVSHGPGWDAGALLGERVRLADAPFVEGAVSALVCAAGGGSLTAVVRAAEEAREYRKV